MIVDRKIEVRKQNLSLEISEVRKLKATGYIPNTTLVAELGPLVTQLYQEFYPSCPTTEEPVGQDWRQREPTEERSDSPYPDRPWLIDDNWIRFLLQYKQEHPEPLIDGYEDEEKFVKDLRPKLNAPALSYQKWMTIRQRNTFEHLCRIASKR